MAWNLPLTTDFAQSFTSEFVANQGGFKPSNQSGLGVWLDASDLSTLTFNGSTISAWANKGNTGAGNAVQATTSAQPLYIASSINSLPALRGRHDGTNPSQLLITDSAALNYTTFEMFVVYKRNTDLGAIEMIGGKYAVTGNQREMRVLISASDQLAVAAGTDGTAGTLAQATFGSAAALNTPYVANGRYDATNLIVQQNNGTAVTAALASIFAGTVGFSVFSRDTTFADPAAIDLSEILFFTAIRTVSERTQINNYLSAKYGISL